MKNYIWGILSAICFGSITTLGKLLLVDTNAETVLFLRFTIVCSLILLGYFVFNRFKGLGVRKKHIKFMALAGLAFSFETIGFWIALGHLTIIELLAIFWTFPLMIAVINSATERKLNLKAIGLLALGTLGVVLVTGGF